MDRKQRMGDALHEMRVMLEAARKPEALAVLEGYGYLAVRLDEGQAYHLAAEQAYIKAQKEQGQALGASQALEESIARAYRIYMGHVRQARAIFRGNRERLNNLGVVGPRKLDRAGWMRQASDFYQHAQSDPVITDVLLAQGIDVSEGVVALQEVQQLHVDHKRERAEARQARLERDDAFAAMQGWRRVFISVARMAFRDAPRLLGQLGI